LVTLWGCADARDVFLPYRPSASEIAEVTQRGAPLPRYDAAVVPGCPANPDGTPSLCERCLVKSAVRAFKKGKAGLLVFSGAAAHSPQVEADVMGALAERRGVPSDRVLREPRALTTWQNIRFSERLIAAHGARTVLFISTAGHLPRVRRFAHFYGIDDDRAGYLACDLDLPPDSDEEFAPPAPPAPTVDD
jgi:uncharacterized SAM-binding protein YcdF (DUF218 family)